jgi:hypothetical protein
MLQELRAPFADQVAVRTYFFKAEELRRINRFKELLLELPPELRGIVGERMVKMMVDGMARPGLRYIVPLGTHDGRDICARLALRIDNGCYTPMEKFGEERCLYVLNKGIALKMGFVLLRGSVFGQDLLLKHAFLRQPPAAIAFRHVIVQHITLAALTEVFEPYKQEWAVLCTQAARMSVIKCVVLAAKKIWYHDEYLTRGNPGLAGLFRYNEMNTVGRPQIADYNKNTSLDSAGQQAAGPTKVRPH